MSDIKLSIHPKQLEAFDKRADALISHIIRRPIKDESLEADFFVPDFDIQHTFKADEAEHITSKIVDVDGNSLSRFLTEGNEEIGLDEQPYHHLISLVKDFQGRHELKSYLSTAAVEDAIFQWLTARFLKRTDLLMCRYCLPILEGTIVQSDQWVPIFGIHTECSFVLGKTTIHPITRHFFDMWEQALVANQQIHTEGIMSRVSDFRRQLQGGAACTIKLQAELRRAQEIALEEAENTLSLLRIYLPSNFHPSIPSYCRPFGREGIECDLIFSVVGSSSPTWVEGVPITVRRWHLTKSTFEDFKQLGLGDLQGLYLLEKKSEFQTALLTSVMTYSKSSLMRQPSDRLIYIFTALDSFLLQDNNEKIQQNIAERIAFTISKEAGERMKIKKTIIAAYAMRSAAVHHGQTLKDREIMIEFLQITFRFFASMIIDNGRHKSRQDFFNEVETLKFS